ncbi:helix-turn-helix transcriptional regulator [Gymnodinialimonas hymeniacidonis]|uniref:helix-turn-helix transcriptional regulator n=1 Tax=Gymnodinialimonas hymeniacidonis TaxID=3126508 RepID=UPI0034C5EE2B
MERQMDGSIASPSGSDPQGLLDEHAVADLICHSVRTIQKWRVTGQGPEFFKLGRSVRYRRSDVLAWVDSRRKGSTSQ